MLWKKMVRRRNQTYRNQSNQKAGRNHQEGGDQQKNRAYSIEFRI